MMKPPRAPARAGGAPNVAGAAAAPPPHGRIDPQGEFDDAADATVPPGAAPTSNLAGLLSLGFMVGTINGLGRVAFPLYATAIGALPWQVGIVGGLGYTGLLLLALPMGAWIDRHGSRLLFMRGAAVATVLYLLLPLARSPLQMVLAVGMLGLMLPFRTVPAHTEFIALVPHLSASKAGWNRAANTMGMFFVGPAVSAAVIAALGFAAVFELAAAAQLGALLLAGRVLSPPPAHAAHADVRLVARIRSQFALLRGQRELRRTMAIDFISQMAIAYFVVFGLVLAVRRYGLSVQAAAGLVTLQGAFFVATLFAGGAWLARFGEDKRYLIAFVLLFAQGVLFGFAPGAAALWTGAALMGVGIGLQSLVSVNRFAQAMQVFGRGRIGGLTSLGPPAGGVLGAMLGGLVSQQLGAAAGFRMLAAAYALLIVLQVRRLRGARHAALG